MENTRISDLNYVEYTSFTPNDLFVLVNYTELSGETKNTTLTDVKDYILDNLYLSVSNATYDDANTFTFVDNSGGTFNITMNIVTGWTINGNLNISGDTNQFGNLNISGDTNQNGNLNISGDTNQFGNLNISGDTNQFGNLNISGDTNQNGNLNISGDTNQFGNLNISGDFCMTNMNSGGQPTGTNCFDTTLIATGVTVVHKFQNEGGVIAHLGDLSTGEPNSRGYTFFENNTTVTSFVSVGTGVYTPIIGAPQTINEYNNLFIVTTGTTTATTNKLIYNFPEASGTTSTFLKFTIALSVELAQNQQITFQLQRNRNMLVTNIPIGMSVTPTGNGAVSISFNGVVDAQYNDEFVVVVKNNTGSGTPNSIRVSNLSFSMFT